MISPAQVGGETGGERVAHPYHMYDAIRRQPEAVAELLSTARATLERAADAAAARERILFAGIGTSYHAAQAGEQMLRRLTGGQALAGVEQSFELCHYPLRLGHTDAVALLSHRGWKNYSVQALGAARAAGALTLAITGREGGEGMKAANFVVTTCEQEQSSAHTKSYTTALAALAVFAVRVAERRGALRDPRAALAALKGVPDLLRHALETEAQARRAAKRAAERQRLVFIGAGPNWATAREGALKVKETSYLAAEGFETEEFLHGPITELDLRAALIAILAGGPADERALAILRAAGELGVLRIGVGTRGTGKGTRGATDCFLEVPDVPEWLSPLVHIVPLQLLSYFIAIEHGSNPDTQRKDDPRHVRAQEHFEL